VVPSSSTPDLVADLPVFYRLWTIKRIAGSQITPTGIKKAFFQDKAFDDQF
jgi:hypothetical protein